MEKTIIFTPDTDIQNILYFHASPVHTQETAQKLWKALQQNMKESRSALVMLTAGDWNQDLSPWKTERVFSKGEDFEGGADAYLTKLCQTIIPDIETKIFSLSENNMENTAVLPKRRMIGGYSMGGLFAVYAGYRTDLFTDVISVSGSLWFDGFAEFIKNSMPSSRWKHCYLSLGNKEKLTKNKRMAKVEENTLLIKQYLEQAGITAVYESNPGNHFYQSEERMIRGIRNILDYL